MRIKANRLFFNRLHLLWRRTQNFSPRARTPPARFADSGFATILPVSWP